MLATLRGQVSARRMLTPITAGVLTLFPVPAGIGGATASPPTAPCNRTGASMPGRVTLGVPAGCLMSGNPGAGAVQRWTWLLEQVR